jgi:hypothetical protein
MFVEKVYLAIRIQPQVTIVDCSKGVGLNLHPKKTRTLLLLVILIAMLFNYMAIK